MLRLLIGVAKAEPQEHKEIIPTLETVDSNTLEVFRERANQLID